MTTSPASPAAHGIDSDGQLVRAAAPASGVSVPRHMGVGSDLVHSLDYVVLLQVMFNLASGVSSTPMSVWKQLQERGIRSAKNAQELVGKNAVYESFARLQDAGYLRRLRLPNEKHPGRMGPVTYEVYDNPAWNPDWDPGAKGLGRVKPQVAPLPGTPDVVSGEVDKTAGQNTSRNAGRVNTTSGVPGSGGRRVSAGQNTSPVPGRGKASPPHPPEEVTTSSPYPLTGPTGALPSPREEEGAEFSSEEIQRAGEFLQTMQRWQAGAATARKCALPLLRTMRSEGWPSMSELDAEQRRLLEAEVLRNTTGATSWARCLPGWVKDLRRFDKVTEASTPEAASDGMCPKHPTYRAGSRCIPCVTA